MKTTDQKLDQIIELLTLVLSKQSGIQAPYCKPQNQWTDDEYRQVAADQAFALKGFKP